MQRTQEIEIAKVNRLIACQHSSVPITAKTQEKIEGYKKHIETLLSLEHYYQKLLTVPMPNAGFSISSGEDRHFFISSYPGVRKVGEFYPTLRALALLGWRRTEKTKLPSGNDTGIDYRFTHKDDSSLRVTLQSSLMIGEQGDDICYRVQVGEENKTVPIYKVVCPDSVLEEEVAA